MGSVRDSAGKELKSRLQDSEASLWGPPHWLDETQDGNTEGFLEPKNPWVGPAREPIPICLVTLEVHLRG